MSDTPKFNATEMDIHSPFNACQHRGYCQSLLAELADARAELKSASERETALSDALDYLHGLTPAKFATLRSAEAERDAAVRIADGLVNGAPPMSGHQISASGLHAYSAWRPTAIDARKP